MGQLFCNLILENTAEMHYRSTNHTGLIKSVLAKDGSEGLETNARQETYLLFFASGFPWSTGITLKSDKKKTNFKFTNRQTYFISSVSGFTWRTRITTKSLEHEIHNKIAESD